MWWRPRPRPIRELTEGAIATVAGTLRLAGRPVVAPLSARPCALYDAREWLAVAFWRRDLGSSNFWVEDATGRALVRMPVSRARLKLVRLAPRLREGLLGDGARALVRGRVSFHVVPDPWDPTEYREARAVPVLYGEGRDLLDVWGG